MLRFSCGWMMAVVTGAWLVASQDSRAQEQDAEPRRTEVRAVEASPARGAPPEETGVSAQIGVEANAAASSSPNGAQTQYSGKIIIVGPDGKRQEINIGDPNLLSTPAGVPPLPPGVSPPPNWPFPKRYGLRTLTLDPQARVYAYTTDAGDHAARTMIGVACSAAGDALRSQLKLGEGGVVVDTVIENTPADKAGLQVHDILLKAGESDLLSPEDLVEAVKLSADKPLSIGLLRGGEKMVVEVTPVLQAEVRFTSPHYDAVVSEWFHAVRPVETKPLSGDVVVDARVVGPGAFIPAGAGGGDPARMDRMEAQLQQLSQQIEQLQKAIEAAQSQEAKE